jgi:hypothetical protein
MIFMILKIKIIAQIFNKIRFISLYSKFCEGGVRQNLCILGAHQSVQMRTKRGRGRKSVQKSVRTMHVTHHCIYIPLKKVYIL